MATASSTEICNMALSHLGVGAEIGVLSTENSNEAKACRRFYEIARDVTFRDFAWPFAQTIADLGLVETDPNDEWGYSYSYPSDCLKLKRILSGLRNDTHQSRIPFKIIHSSSGNLILTDAADAQLEYTMLVESIEMWPADFVMAFSYRLAISICPRLTGGDPFKIISTLAALYRAEIANARSNAANEEQLDNEPDSEFIRTREG